MLLLLLLGSIAFLAALILTPLCRELFLRWGVVDHPDGVRRLHERPVPRIGGIAVAVAYALPFLAFALFLPTTFHTRMGGSPFGWELPAAASMMFALGLLDDLVGLKAWQKLLGQCIPVLLAWHGGVRIIGIHGFIVGPPVALSLTALWLLGCTNAFNLIDGIDGLAAGVGIFATVTIVLSAILQPNMALAIATVPLAAALAGFLYYNFSPASIFLGDSGSLTVGFLLGCYAVVWRAKSSTMLGMTAPIIALAIPIADSVLAVFRRWLRGQPIFTGDRGHIHHRLLDLGLTPRRAVLLLYWCCGLAGALSLLLSVKENSAGIVIVLFCPLAWIAIQRLGYVEFDAVKSFAGEGMTSLRAQVHVREFRDRLGAAATPDDCWEVLRRYYQKFGFSQITLQLAGETYHEDGTESIDSVDGWSVLIPLSRFEYVQLYRNREPGSRAIGGASFADTLATVLKARCSVFETEATSRLDAEVAGPMPDLQANLRSAGGAK